MTAMLLWLARHWYSTLLIIGIVYAVWYEIRHQGKWFADSSDSESDL